MFAQAIGDIKNNMPALIEKIKIDAQLHRTKYKELIKQGFSESQALTLCEKLY